MNSLRYNIRTGLLNRWKRLFIPLAIYLYLAVPVSDAFVMLNRGGSFLSLLVYIFVGKNPSFGEALELPIAWMILQIGCLMYHLDYPVRDLTGYGYQIFIRCNSRTTWWNAKYIWCILSTIAYWGSGVIVLIIYCFLKGFAIDISLSRDILEMFFDSGFLPQITEYTPMNIVFHVFVMPLSTMISLNLLQMYFSVSLNSSALGFFLTCVLLVWSVFQCTPIAIGNYGMLQRNAVFSTYGVSYATGLWVLLFIDLIVLVAGQLSIKKRNLLGMSTPGGSE